MQIGGEGPEAPHRLGVTPGRDRRHVQGGADVDGDRMGMDWGHIPPRAGAFARVMAGASSSNWRAGLREIINFRNGIVRHAGASPHSSPQQPLGQVLYLGPGPPKTGRPPRPPPMIAPAVSAATGGTRSATVS